MVVTDKESNPGVTEGTSVKMLIQCSSAEKKANSMVPLWHPNCST